MSLFTDIHGAPLPSVTMSGDAHTLAVSALFAALAGLAILGFMINAKPRDPGKPKKRFLDYFDHTDGGQYPPPGFP